MCCCPSTSTPAPMKTPAAWKRISRIQPQAVRMRANLPGWKTPTEAIKGDTGSPAASSSVRSQESRRLADTVQKCTLSVMKEKTFTVRDRRVKSGPFKGLARREIFRVSWLKSVIAQTHRKPPTLRSPHIGRRWRKGSLPASLPIWAASTGTSADPFPYAFFPVWQHFLPSPVPSASFTCASGKKRKRCSVLLE